MLSTSAHLQGLLDLRWVEPVELLGAAHLLPPLQGAEAIACGLSQKMSVL